MTNPQINEVNDDPPLGNKEKETITDYIFKRFSNKTLRTFYNDIKIYNEIEDAENGSDNVEFVKKHLFRKK